MTTPHKITTTALATALFGLLLFAGYGWLKEHDAAITVGAQQKADKDALAVLHTQESENQARLVAALQNFAAMKQTVQTPAQIVKALPQVINLPAPVVQLTDAQAKAADAAGLPDAPKLQGGDLIIPKDSVKSFYDAQVDCKANEAKLASCTQTVANDNSVVAVKDTEISQLQTALKGGSKWHRAKGALKAVGIGALIGGAAVAYIEYQHK